MKNTDQIRQLLQEINKDILPRIHVNYPPSDLDVSIRDARWDCSEKIRQISARLPCETCNGKGRLPRSGDDPRYQFDHCVIKAPACSDCEFYKPAPPCPDCKSS